MEWFSRLKLDLEAVVEDASNEVYSFEIQRSLIYSKLVLIVHHLIILSDLFIRIPLKEGLSQ